MGHDDGPTSRPGRRCDSRRAAPMVWSRGQGQRLWARGWHLGGGRRAGSGGRLADDNGRSGHRRLARGRLPSASVAGGREVKERKVLGPSINPSSMPRSVAPS